MSGHPLSPRHRAVPALVLTCCAVLGAFHSLHADWLHYRGPTQNGVSPEKGWKAEFPAGGPKVVWTKKVGKGTTSVTIQGDRAYTMGNEGGNDTIFCLNAKTGAEIWKHVFPLELDPNMFEGGPRTTPTIDGDRVYTVSHQGDLWCLNAATGAKIWYKHYQRELGGERPTWGYSGSPTVSGDLLICDIGGKGASTVAFNKLTGDVVWKSGNHKAGYASPVVATLDGKQTVVVFKGEALVGMDLKTGKELWSTAWKTDYDVNAATPLIWQDRVFVSSGYNNGCALFQITGGQAKQIYRNKNLRAQINSPAPWAGRIYGIDNNSGGNLVCLNAATGEELWEERSVKGGSLIATDGKLIVLTEKGDLVTVDVTTPKFKEISRAPGVLKGRCWVQPTLDNGLLYLRDNEGDMVCLQLK